MIGLIRIEELAMKVRTSLYSISHVLVDPDEATGIALITLEETDGGTQNRIVVCPGANFTISVQEIEWLRGSVRDYDMVIMQFELPMEIVETIAEWAYEVVFL